MENTNIQREDNDELEINLLDLLLEFKRRIWALILGLLIGLVIAGFVTVKLMDPTYQSEATVFIIGNGSSSSSLTDLQVGEKLTNDYKVIFSSRMVLQEVIDELQLNMTWKQLQGWVSVSNVQNTRSLNLSVTCGDPELACDIANAILDHGVETARGIDETAKIQPMPAVAEYSPVGPNLKRNLLAGGFAGIFLVAAIIVVLYLLRDTIQSPDDIEKFLRLPVLCEIPYSKDSDYSDSSSSSKKRKSGKLSSNKNSSSSSRTRKAGFLVTTRKAGGKR